MGAARIFAGLSASALLGLGCGFLSNDLAQGSGTFTGKVLVAGVPAHWAVVQALDEVLANPYAKVLTDTEGRFRIAARIGGRQRFAILWGDSFGLQRDFLLALTTPGDLGQIELEPVGALAGSVDLGGNDPRLAEVRVLGTDWLARPDKTGQFRLVLPAGSWQIAVVARGYLTEVLSGQAAESGNERNLGNIALEIDPSHYCDVSLSVSERTLQRGTGAVDFLFMLDNSRSMVAEQVALGRSFANFNRMLQSGRVDYRIAVVTPGIESPACDRCMNAQDNSCINDTGETGRFQSLKCKNVGSVDAPLYQCDAEDPACRIITSSNLGCFFDEATASGIAMVGIQGCGYERGLAAVRRALSPPLLGSTNEGFLRPEARLAVVAISDEEDCGEVGDVTENLSGISGKVCSYAAAGHAPDGYSVDPTGKPYALTSIEETADFLKGLKANPWQVTFSAIVGVTDPANPDATAIEFENTSFGADVKIACTAQNCAGTNCNAYPGTRYIRLARQMGGEVLSICSDDFSDFLSRIGSLSTGFQTEFPLTMQPRSPVVIAVRVDAKLVGGWSYDSAQNAIRFDLDAVPPPWSSIEIEYLADCP